MLEEDKELYEIINNLNEELDEVLELLDEPIQDYNKRKINENLSEKKNRKWDTRNCKKKEMVVVVKYLYKLILLFFNQYQFFYC